MTVLVCYCLTFTGAVGACDVDASLSLAAVHDACRLTPMGLRLRLGMNRRVLIMSTLQLHLWSEASP